MTDSFEIDPREIAKWFVLATDRESGNATTHLKVQKLLYYAQGWSLAKFGKPLFDEDLQAWAHGPVCRSVYDYYKNCGFDPLPTKKVKASFGSSVLRLLTVVNDKYSIYSAKGLEAMTHKERPWLEARGDLPADARCGTVISKKTMKDHFLRAA